MKVPVVLPAFFIGRIVGYSCGLGNNQDLKNFATYEQSISLFIDLIL